MKKEDVQIGGRYVVRISQRPILDVVTITGESPHGGWVGIVKRSGWEIHIKTAGRLRAPAADEKGEIVGS